MPTRHKRPGSAKASHRSISTSLPPNAKDRSPPVPIPTLPVKPFGMQVRSPDHPAQPTLDLAGTPLIAPDDRAALPRHGPRPCNKGSAPPGREHVLKRSRSPSVFATMPDDRQPAIQPGCHVRLSGLHVRYRSISLLGRQSRPSFRSSSNRTPAGTGTQIASRRRRPRPNASPCQHPVERPSISLRKSNAAAEQCALPPLTETRLPGEPGIRETCHRQRRSLPERQRFIDPDHGSKPVSCRRTPAMPVRIVCSTRLAAM